ncbi:hypothetical protein [Priestia megaterium]|uniref:hypothetical protein n=1 Tax=Priestia megaterium TaxID=1404 RepID=UPI0031FC4DEC
MKIENMTAEQIEERIEIVDGELFSLLESVRDLNMVAEREGFNRSVCEELLRLTSEIQTLTKEMEALNA